MSHAPGPWYQSHRKCPDGNYRTQVYDSAGQPIANLAWHVADPTAAHLVTTRPYNAYLIAAAPDLLDALKRVTRHMATHIHSEQMGADLDAAYAAINKAEGR